jgi:uncharacterized protein (TIGR03437 family)
MLRELHSISLTALVVALSVTAFSQTPVINKGGILNSASSSGNDPVAPGSLITIFGTDLASAPAVADSVPLSRTLGNVSVTVNGVAAPLLYVSPTQINAEVPWEADKGETSESGKVIVTSKGKVSASESVNIGPYSPGVFQYLNHALAVIVTDPADPRYGLIAAAPGAIPSRTTARAAPGDIVMFYATGLGPVTPPAVTGADSMDHVRTVNVPPIVQIGGAQADLKSATLSPQFPGIYQVNVQVPSIPASDAAPLQILLGGMTTPASVTMAVGQ